MRDVPAAPALVPDGHARPDDARKDCDDDPSVRPESASSIETPAIRPTGRKMAKIVAPQECAITGGISTSRAALVRPNQQAAQFRCPEQEPFVNLSFWDKIARRLTG